MATRTVRLSWQPSPSSDVVGYEVARSDGAPNPTAVVGSTAALLYDDARPYGAWSYRVRAFDGAGNRSAWTETGFIVAEPGQIRPTYTLTPRLVPAPALAVALLPAAMLTARIAPAPSLTATLLP